MVTVKATGVEKGQKRRAELLCVMLGEGFLRVLRYREERKFASASKGNKVRTRSHNGEQTDPSEEGPNQKDPDPIHSHGLGVVPQGALGISIPRNSPVLTLDPDLTLSLDNCSLLEHYPDIQVADSGLISHNPLKASQVPHQPAWRECQAEPIFSASDQGYLVMGSRVNINLDLPSLGPEPMSNSLLNGLLDKQLDEVYLQHLTDNLARCNSHLGNSLLHGLVPPPQPSSQPQGLDSLEASMEERSGGENGKICYLSTQNLVLCSSNFSSPVLRISEADSTHL